MALKTVDVQDGDSWESIAFAHCVELSVLLSANGVGGTSSPHELEVGFSVLLPSATPAVCVAPGAEHTVDLGGEERLWIRLDMPPGGAAADKGCVRVHSTDGAHDVTLPIAGNYVSNGDSVDMVFEGLDAGASYSIDYVAADGSVTNIVAETAFSRLQDPHFASRSPDHSNRSDSGTS